MGPLIHHTKSHLTLCMLLIYIQLIGCDDGWISGLGLCYKLMSQLATFDSAAQKCTELESHLVTIESQQESDFITNWLMATTSKITYVLDNGIGYTLHGTCQGVVSNLKSDNRCFHQCLVMFLRDTRHFYFILETILFNSIKHKITHYIVHNYQ